MIIAKITSWDPHRRVLYDKKGNVRAIHGGDIWIHDHEVNNYKVIETPKGFQVIPSN